ncbi:hypothetical protein CP061683_0021B, partial [Chlamydia psittaci 06-1683]
ATGAQLFR